MNTRSKIYSAIPFFLMEAGAVGVLVHIEAWGAAAFLSLTSLFGALMIAALMRQALHEEWVAETKKKLFGHSAQ